MMAQYHVQQVWLGLLDAERLSRYYGRLSERFQRVHLYLMVMIALCSTGAALTLLATFQDLIPVFGQLPGLIPALLSFVVAGAAIWASHSDYSKKAAISSVIRIQCDELVVSWKQLWLDVSTDPESVRVRTVDLQRRMNEVTAHALENGLTNDALNRECAKEAYESLQSEFAS